MRAATRRNVFTDIGFAQAEADELAAKADLLTLLLRAIRERKLTQAQAARLCGTDQPTLSKALNGRLGSVTIDRLTKWIVALGGRIRIEVKPPRARARTYKGEMRVRAA